MRYINLRILCKMIKYMLIICSSHYSVKRLHRSSGAIAAAILSDLTGPVNCIGQSEEGDEKRSRE